MDLRKKFGTDQGFETDGVDVHLGDDAYITIRRAGGANRAYVECTRRLLQKHRRAIAADTMTDTESEALMAEIYAETIVIGWRGIELDGTTLLYSRANVLRLFQELPDVAKVVQEEAQRAANFRADEVHELGESSAPR